MTRRGCLARTLGGLLALLLLLLAWLFLAPRPRDWDWQYHDAVAAQGSWDSPYPATVRLEVAPQDALADVPLAVRVTGLRPRQRVGLRAWTVDKDGRRWETSGIWQADAAGAVDLSRDRPLRAPFTEPDPSALLTAMRPVSPAAHPLFLAPTDRLPAYRVHIRAEAGGRVLAEMAITRRHVARGVSCTEVREGDLVGVYCLPPGDSPFPAVLVLGGSEGDIPRIWPAWWASHGVAALGLAYFGVEPLPPNLVHIPLERFLRAVDWLRDRPAVDAERVFVWGVSRGSEAALLTAAYHPGVAGVIAVSPSSVVWSGLDFSQGPRSAWTYRGRPLPFLTTALSLDYLRMGLGIPVALRDEFERGLRKATEEVFIPVERVRGPVLLIAGTDDRLWPSDVFVRQMEERLAARGFSHPVRTVVVEAAGHAFSPFLEPPVRVVPPLVLGGNREANLHLAREGTAAMLDWAAALFGP
ncbi:MAG: acyl-CoA thioesterase/bile acid-CoA:amino acid N-acyltransferase family protein [Ardenticatenia bacterium]|nr:acyl-CoA thioesterase/bile acid-CoA:amino acid N-acyltransferase family protein [Ardenticatenia bacterium]